MLNTESLRSLQLAQCCCSTAADTHSSQARTITKTMAPGSVASPSSVQGDTLKLWGAVLQAVRAKWAASDTLLVVVAPPPPLQNTVEWVALLQKCAPKLVLVPVVPADLAMSSPLAKAADAAGIRCFPMFSHEAGIFHAIELAWAELLPKAKAELHLGAASTEPQVFNLVPTTITSHDNADTSIASHIARQQQRLVVTAVQQAEAKSIRHVDVVCTPWLLTAAGSAAPAWPQICAELERKKTALIVQAACQRRGQSVRVHFALFPGQGGSSGILQQLRSAEDIVHTATGSSTQQGIWDAGIQDALDTLPAAALAPLSLTSRIPLPGEGARAGAGGAAAAHENVKS